MYRSPIFAAVLILTFTSATGISGYSQDEHKDKIKQQDSNRNKQQEPNKNRDASVPHQPVQPKRTSEPPRGSAQRPASQGDNGRHLGQQKQIVRNDKQQNDEQIAQRQAWQERRANHWEYEHKSWQQRGGYQGVRIDNDFFRTHYGTSHVFRVYNLPFIYEGGNPRFQYEGYWFTMMDPYPEYWGATWYETDDLFVDYQGDGYYLFNRSYPGRPGIALNITL